MSFSVTRCSIFWSAAVASVGVEWVMLLLLMVSSDVVVVVVVWLWWLLRCSC